MREVADEQSELGPQMAAARGGGKVTGRCLVLGVLMSALIGVIGPYWTFYLHTSTMFLDFSTAGATFLLFALVLIVNGFFRLVRPAWRLTRAELLVVSAMMMLASSITTMGLTGYLIPNITAPYYFANNYNRWETLVQPYIAKWMIPLDPGGGTTAIEQFYAGLPAGASIPWGTWLRPLLYWAIFIMALYLASVTLMIIFRRQWVDYERLVYPIAQVPLALAETGDGSAGQTSFLRDVITWIGFAIPFLFGTYNALSAYFPNVIPRPIEPWTSIPIFDRSGQINIRLSFAMIGLTFMVPNRLAFSLWSLNLVSVFSRALTKRYGMEMTENLGIYGAGPSPIAAHQGQGALLALTVMGVWHSRRHLANVLGKAFGRRREVDDSDEILSYRGAVFVFIACFLIMTVWMTRAGLPAPMSVIFIVCALAILMGLTRAVTQGGVAVSIVPIIPSAFMVSGFGAAALTSKGVGALAMTWTWGSDVRTTVMTSCAHGLYLTSGLRGRRIFGGYTLAILVTFVVSTLMTLYLGYRKGAVNLHTWFFSGGPKYPYLWCTAVMRGQTEVNWTGWGWTGFGAAVMAALIILQRRFYWWPLHPVGWALCSVAWTDYLTFSIFLGWLLKSAVLRFGGSKHYQRFRRLFLGMILGQFAVAGFWACIDTLAGKVGNSIFWI